MDDLTAPRTLAELRFFLAADQMKWKPHPVSPSALVVKAFRLSQFLWRRPRLRSLSKVVEWGIVMSASSQLSPSAEVGAGLRLPHPIGVVIGGRCRLGRDVFIAQNVTLGSNYRRQKDGGDQPTLGDGVFVNAGAVLAGPITVGAGAVVGANVVLTIDVPPGAVVRAAHAQVVPRGGSAVDTQPDE